MEYKIIRDIFIGGVVLTLTFSAGLGIGWYETRTDMREKAIHTKAAMYHPETGEFTWSVDYEAAKEAFCNALGYRSQKEIKKCMQK